MTECLHCRNTARHNSLYCGRCEDAIAVEEREAGSLAELDNAIASMDPEAPVTIALNSIRDLLEGVLRAS